MIEIYTDGSCRKHGIGGYGIVVVKDGKLTGMYRGWAEDTTNNRMEMIAIIKAKKLYGRDINDFNSDIPIVYSDSAYCVNTFNEWAVNWKKHGWVKYDGGEIKNLDLVQEYFQYPTEIELKYIKGHAGNRFNELADKLATGTNIIAFKNLLPNGTAFFKSEEHSFEFTF